MSASPPAMRVAEVVTVVVAVEPGRAGEAGAGEDPPGLGDDIASCCSSVVLWAFSCCCFFLTSCSADLRSSRVTPWVERRVSRTLLACAFLWISCSSSRTGGTKDLATERVRHGKDWEEPSQSEDQLVNWYQSIRVKLVVIFNLLLDTVERKKLEGVKSPRSTH